MLFWLARVSSTIAYQMLAVAVGWQTMLSPAAHSTWDWWGLPSSCRCFSLLFSWATWPIDMIAG